MNDSGTVVFDGLLAGEPCFSRVIDFGCRSGVYARRTDGTIRVIARAPVGTEEPVSDPLVASGGVPTTQITCCSVPNC